MSIDGGQRPPDPPPPPPPPLEKVEEPVGSRTWEAGNSVQPDGGDAPPGPTDDHLDPAGAGNHDWTGGQDPVAGAASDSQTAAGSTAPGSDEMSSRDASADRQDDQDRRDQDDQDRRDQDEARRTRYS